MRNLVVGTFMSLDGVVQAPGGPDEDREGGFAHGGWLQTLLETDLVDTLRIWHFPVVLGSGKRLFNEGAMPSSFRVVEQQQTTAGAVLNVYERADALKYGEVEVGQETVVFE